MTTFVLVAIISTLLVKLVITLKEVYITGDIKTTLLTKQGVMTDKIYKDLSNLDLTKIEKCEENNCVNFVYKNISKKFIIDKTKKTVTYDNYTIKLGKDGYQGEITLDKYNSDIGFILNFKVPIYNKLVKGNYGLNITYQIDNDIEFDNEIVFDVIDKGVTVTFDANGGTADKTKKQVTVGDTYGKLPIPEREGYVFKGWNGKNLFDYKEILKSNSDTVTEQELNGVQTLTWINGANTNNQKFLQGYFKNDTQYTISGKIASSNTYKQMYIKYVDGSSDYVLFSTHENPNTFYEFTKKSDTNNSINYLSGTYHTNERIYLDINSFQIEEGDKATEYEPYYVESNTKVVQDKNHTLKAIWEKKESTFIAGSSVNSKFKKLANPNQDGVNYSSPDTNVKNIKRYTKKPKKSILNNAEIVSTSDSKYPIYAWFDNGTIYYYTEALNPYLSGTAEAMFYNFQGLKTIDLSTLDTSKTYTMRDMFNSCFSLTSLDLSNFTTPALNNMWGMFASCKALTNINFGNNFDTSQVTLMYATFGNCQALSSLDLSKLDLTSSTNVTNIFSGMIALTTLKTPKEYPSDSSVTITLPSTFKDSSNNTYTSLNNTSPKSTTLTKQ